MLHKITVENFRSINEEMELSFMVDKKFKETDRCITSRSGERVSIVEAVVGPNASGKTNLLNALVAVQWLIAESLEDRMQMSRIISPFAGNPKDRPVKISVVFEIDGEIYKYYLSTTKERMIEEGLTITNKSPKRMTTKTLFARSWNGKNYDINSKLGFFNVNFDRISDKYLRKLSLLAIAAFYGDEAPMVIVGYWKKLKTNIEFGFSFSPPGYEAIIAMRNMKQSNVLKPFESFDTSINSYDPKKQVFQHSYDDSFFELDLDQESSGTQRYIVIVEMLASVLKNGGIAVIDEFDAYLHPLMFEKLVTQFFDKKRNKHGAQLLLSTHSLELLSHLDQYQIVLVDKSNSSSKVTRLDRLQSVKVRSDDNYYTRYMRGEYGAVPPITH